MKASTVEGRLNSRWDRRRSCLNYYYKGKNDKNEHRVKEESNAHIWKLQCKCFAREMLRILRANIETKEQYLQMILSDDPSQVLERLPRAYRPNEVFKPKGKLSLTGVTGQGISNSRPGRVMQSENPYKREELNIQTSFGLYVRTKGELIIAELLYSLGVEFFYERALTLNVTREHEAVIEGRPVKKRYRRTITYYPDFTIILPDGRTFYWEHKGMMNNIDYARRDAQKNVDYNMNHIFQPHNYIVTEEGPDNSIDFEGIKKMVEFMIW